MAENTMKLEVITPERSFYTGDVTFVELNTTEGEVGIYARHIPMTMIIAPGVLTGDSAKIQRITGYHRNLRNG